MTAQTTTTRAQRVTELISEQMDIPTERITLDSAFESDLGFDSLDMVEFVMAVEEEFDISVPDDTSEKIKTVGQAIEAIQQTIAEREHRP